MPRLNRYVISSSGKDAVVDRTVDIAVAHIAGLRLVLIDADLVPDESNSVIATLAKTGVSAAEQWKFDDDYEERLRYEVDPRWHGEIPYTILIAADGATTTVAGAADLSQVRAWLDAQSKARP
jgi:hypothetical protein